MTEAQEVIQDMPAEEYHATHGLSVSGMKDLAVSPLRFWHKWLNPDRQPDEPTPAQQFGSALHCAVLEPGEFDKRYACELIAPEECLVTIDDLRTWIRSKGGTPKGTRKDELIAQCYGFPGEPPVILETLKVMHAQANDGKVIFKADDWQRLQGAVGSVKAEPRVQQLLTDGRPEVSMFATDPETDVLLKARMDWVAPKCTVDLKTFTQQRGKSIDKCVADAIWYERYNWQAYLYSFIRTLQPGADSRGVGPTARASAVPPFVLVFVESEPPHEVRIRELRPMMNGAVSILWERARADVRELIRLYARYMEHFGAEKPWRYAQEIEPLDDAEIPALAFAR
jgi:hypothetical protein